MNTNYEHLLAAVRSMRDWQRTYFKTRSPEALQRAKQAERDVDAIIEKIDNAGKPQQEVLL